MDAHRGLWEISNRGRSRRKTRKFTQSWKLAHKQVDALSPRPENERFSSPPSLRLSLSLARSDINFLRRHPRCWNDGNRKTRLDSTVAYSRDEISPHARIYKFTDFSLSLFLKAKRFMGAGISQPPAFAKSAGRLISSSPFPVIDRSRAIERVARLNQVPGIGEGKQRKATEADGNEG